MMGLDTEFWIVASISILIAGISKSGFAGGIGVITVPLLALQVGPIRAVSIMFPLLMLMDALSVRAWRGKQHNGLLQLLLPGAVIGIFIGYLLFDYLNEQVLSVLLGLFSIGFAVWGLLKGKRLKVEPNSWLGRICGMVAGFTSFFAHAGAPPLNFYLLPLKLPRETFLATSVVFAATVNLVKLIPYTIIGQINMDSLLIASVLVPVAFLGVWLGLNIHHRLNERLFNNIILIMLLLVGCKLTLDGYLIL